MTVRRLLPLVALGTLAGALLPHPSQADSPRTVLAHNEIRGIERAVPTGPAAPGTVLHLNVALRHPDPAAEDAYVQAVEAHRAAPLTAAAFDARFGVSPATAARAVDWLTSAGLSVTAAGDARDDLLVTGTVAQVEPLLQVREMAYAHGVIANAGPPSVPGDVPVLAIAGLTNREQRHLPATAPHPAASGVFTGAFTPQDLWHIYDLPADNRGQGQQLAIFLWGKTDDVLANLRTFEVQNHLPQVPLVKHYYGTDAVDTNAVDQQEADLDLQASTGMAPDVQRITMYMGNAPSDSDLIAATNAWAADPAGALTGSASYSGCEEAGTGSALIPVNPEAGPGDTVFQPMMDQALKRAVGEGRTFFTSAGDTGSSCPFTAAPTNGVANQAVPLAAYPAASPYAVGVGGTVLYGDGSTPENRVTEYTWPYTGGGTSSFVAAPDWQQAVSHIVGHCISQPDGSQYTPPAPLCRGTPDVAAISGDVSGNGYTIVDSATTTGGGTSLSSPLWAGFWARIEAAAPARSGGYPGLGFAAPLIYSNNADAARYANDFLDITTGANGYYTALPGWDYTTGWGVPDVAHLMRDLAGTTTPANPLPAPVPALPGGVHVNPCSPRLFNDAAGDDVYTVEGQVLGAPGTNPQLDLRALDAALSPDGTALRLIVTLTNLSTTIPTGGGENDYRVLFSVGGTTYFAVAAVQPGGTVLYLDGIKATVGPETRYQFLHSDTGVFTAGPLGTVEIDVPLANIGTPAIGAVVTAITAESDVREGSAQAGLLETVDTAGPGLDFGIGLVCRQGSPLGGVIAPLHKPGAPPLPVTAALANTGAGATGAGSTVLALLGLAVATAARGRRRSRTRVTLPR